jgi:hypothetical protein
LEAEVLDAVDIVAHTTFSLIPIDCLDGGCHDAWSRVYHHHTQTSLIIPLSFRISTSSSVVLSNVLPAFFFEYSLLQFPDLN